MSIWTFDFFHTCMAAFSAALESSFIIRNIFFGSANTQAPASFSGRGCLSWRFHSPAFMGRGVRFGLTIVTIW
jgi:hypothetical protein